MPRKDSLFGVIVLVLIVIGLFFFFDVGDIQSVIAPDAETQLKGKYITYYSDETDAQRLPSNPIPEDDLFIYNGNIFTGEGRISINPPKGVRYTLTTKHNFFGQEVAMLIQSNGGTINGYGINVFNVPYIVIFKPHTFDPTQVDVIINNIIVDTIIVSNPFNLIFSPIVGGASLSDPRYFISIDFIGYNAEFACDLSADEVWLTERYGSRVNIDDLTFIPTKLCHEEHPATLRKLDEGETKIFPNPYIDLNTGKTIPERELLSDEVLTIRYATFFVEGVIDQLPPNQEYVCTQRDLNNKCSNWVIQQFVDPLTIIVQCEEHSDCPQPLKNLCPDYFQGCIFNSCVYDDNILEAPICKNELVTIIKDIEKIQERELIVVTGTNIFSFEVNYPSGSFGFGDSPFEAEIDFTCEIPEEGTISFPNPNPECYGATASFEGQRFDLIDGDIFNIRDNIEVTYYAGGKVKFVQDMPFNTKKDLSGTFIFDIIGSPLDIELRGGSEVLKDSEKTINFTIKNNLPSGTLLLKITSIAKRNNQILPEIREERSAQEGDIEISFDMNTSHLGINEFVIQTLYKIIVNNKEILLASDKIKFNMNVVTEFSGLDPEIIVITEVITEVEKVVVIEKEGISTILKVIIGIGGILFVLKLLDII